MDRVAHLCDLREHPRGSRTHQKVSCIAYCRIGGNAGEGIASTTLQTDDEIGGRTDFAPPCIELYETLFGHLHNRLDHIAEAPMLVILQANDIGSRGEDRQCIAGKHLRRLQLLTAETDDQRRSPKVWVETEVSQCPNGDLRTRSVDGNAATVEMRNRNDIINIWILR